jgi:hypothetical protein
MKQKTEYKEEMSLEDLERYFDEKIENIKHLNKRIENLNKRINLLK